jgi:hypothetical protein
MKKILLVAAAAALGFMVTRCNSGLGTPATVGSAMSSGMKSSIGTMQSLGNAMGGNGGTFSVDGGLNILSAATSCGTHAEPLLSGGGMMPQSDPKFALQKFYCTLAADSSGPESVSGAVGLINAIVCAIEKQTVGGLPFDGSAIAITGITLDLSCAKQSMINSMSGTTGLSSTVIAIAGGANVTSALNPTFSEIPGNTHYSHGVKIESVTPGVLKFIIVAKFAVGASNPVNGGDFEFATLGTGTMMQGTAIEFTAGKIYGSGAVKHLWYEARSNRAKTSVGDPICPGTSGSCGFSRHIRISTDISFLNGDIDTVSNMSGIMTDGGDSTGSSGQMNNLNVVTATGGLATGLTGKSYTKAVAPSTLTGSSTIAATFVGGEIGATSCIMSAGTSVTTACGSAPAPLIPTAAMNTFFSPANTTAWLTNSSTHGGLGFTGASTFADTQYGF